jgi:hypothetical protein
MYRNRLSWPSTSEHMLSIISSKAHSLCLHQISSQDLQSYLCYRKIINSIQQSPFCEPNSSSARQEFPRVLWKKKVHFLVNINLLLVPILKQINQFYALNSISWKRILILSLPRSSKWSCVWWFTHWKALCYKLKNRNNFGVLFHVVLHSAKQ